MLDLAGVRCDVCGFLATNEEGFSIEEELQYYEDADQTKPDEIVTIIVCPKCRNATEIVT